ncbi:universal stress protein [Xanthocytophaga agilis]|uniref:Universal stress protein n=1 Tax=Xanthocytophaga agilis TaxID=3048010 RepID=A0AAE3UHA2_9BACT|nr:universal stress protein [Xanthocytophaga agilis]MDJ1504136.1 universal stress protein [Xanthocytophaga agilis]
METILIPTDFSEEATYAVKIATAIAQKTKASIRLLHVIQSVYAYEYNEGSPLLPDNAQDRLSRQIIRAEEKALSLVKDIERQGVKVEYDVQVGSTAKHISNIIAENSGVDLIVMGTKGDTGVHEMFIGSRTEKVVRYATCPVLSVRSHSDGFQLRNVVLATDFSDEIEPLLRKIKDLQDVFEFYLHIVYVNTPINYDTTFNIEERMKNFLKKYELQSYQTVIINEYSQADGINRYAERLQADMIVMVTHGRVGMSYMLDGSIAGEVVNHASIPVLTYNIHE